MKILAVVVDEMRRWMQMGLRMRLADPTWIDDVRSCVASRGISVKKSAILQIKQATSMYNVEILLLHADPKLLREVTPLKRDIAISERNGFRITM